MDGFIAGIAPAYIEELNSLNLALSRQVSHFTSLGLSAENSTSFEDCLLLYLLIRHFKRRSIFEVGTYVGTTAVAMHEAAKLNGGHCTTCDPTDLKALPPGIRFLHAPSADALALLKSEHAEIDFAFFDWVPDRQTIRLANELFTADAILAVHDYKLNPKGEEVVRALNGSYCRIRRGQWHYPAARPVEVAPGLNVNICTAFWLPDSLTGRQPLWRRMLSGLAARPTIPATSSAS